MISSEHRLVLKKYLKWNYTKEVQKKLQEKGIVNKRGRNYSSKMISHILNGKYQNEYIENAIFEVFEERKKQLELQKLNRERILGIKQSDI